jgi:phosphotransacetylase
MSDIREQLEELRAKAADCELLGSLATDPAVREESRKRAAEYHQLIEECETRLKTRAA